jgi:hypothetical protein
MGTFTTSVEIGDPAGRRWETVEVLVDSGATYTMLPRALLEHLVVFADDGVQPRLGAYTLEAFLLAVDPANRRLVPVPGLLKRVLSPTAGAAAGRSPSPARAAGA